MAVTKTVIVSACLLGSPVRYDGCGKACDAALALQRSEGHRLIAVCPEQMGGLPTPRNPAEIVGGSGAEVLQGKARVVDSAGYDVSEAFIKGAQKVLDIAYREGAAGALLKAGSPSCGCRQVYDGTFSGCLKKGEGVTAALLRQHGVAVCPEDEAGYWLYG